MDKLDLEKRLSTKRQPESQCRLYARNSRISLVGLDAISEKGIGEVVCPKTS